MLLEDLAEELTAGVLALLELSTFYECRAALEAVVDGVLLVIGGLLPELTPLWLSTRFKFGL